MIVRRSKALSEIRHLHAGFLDKSFMKNLIPLCFECETSQQQVHSAQHEDCKQEIIINGNQLL